MTSWVWSPLSGSVPGTPGHYQYIVTGGFTFGGGADVLHGYLPETTGGMTLGGNFSYRSDVMVQEYHYAMTGDFVLSGNFGVSGRVWSNVPEPETVWTDDVGFR